MYLYEWLAVALIIGITIAVVWCKKTDFENKKTIRKFYEEK